MPRSAGKKGRITKGQATKERVTRTALELFVDKGVRETTIRDIAHAAGVAEGTLYRHYEGKDQLAEQLFSENYEVMAARLEQIFRHHATFEEGLKAAVRFFCAAFDEDWVLFSYLLLSQHRYLRQRDEALPSPVKVLRVAAHSAMRNGVIPLRDPELLAAMLMGLVLQSAIAKIYGRVEKPLGDYADELAAACWRIAAQPT